MIPASKAGSQAEVGVEIAGEAPSLVSLTYLSERSPERWTSVDAVERGGIWIASLEPRADFFVQAVDAAGNVAFDDNDGRYHAACPSPCSPVEPLYMPALLRR